MKLSIALMACSTIVKYQDQIKNVADTWYKESWSEGVPCCFFTGEQINISESTFRLMNNDHLIHLPGVKDDYLSASDKHWLGLKYMFDNFDSDFIMIAGTDNYIDVKNLKTILAKYDCNHPFIISGKQQSRDCAGIRFQIFPLGGCGIIFTRAAVKIMYNYLSSFKNDW